MTVFRTGAFGLLLVVTTSDETSHGDTIAASTASIFGVPLLFWSFSCSFCEKYFFFSKNEREKGKKIQSENENIHFISNIFFSSRQSNQIYAFNRTLNTFDRNKFASMRAAQNIHTQAHK